MRANLPHAQLPATLASAYLTSSTKIKPDLMFLGISLECHIDTHNEGSGDVSLIHTGVFSNPGIPRTFLEPEALFTASHKSDDLLSITIESKNRPLPVLGKKLPAVKEAKEFSRNFPDATGYKLTSEVGKELPGRKDNPESASISSI